MTSRDFCFWAQGFIELANPKTLNEEQTELFKKHLNLVFKHEIDPSMGDEKHQAELNKIHKPAEVPSHLRPNSGIFPNENGIPLRC